MLPSWLGYIAAASSLIATSLYIRDMVRGTTKPNRVTWLLWSLAPLIAAGVEFGNGAGVRVLPIFMGGLSPLLVFFASFLVKNAYAKLGKLDLICGLLSITALYIWLALGEGTIAVLCALLSDLLASIPTLIKAWKKPESETLTSYAIYAGNSIIAMLIARSFSISAFLFPAYFFVLNGFVVLLILRKRKF